MTRKRHTKAGDRFLALPNPNKPSGATMRTVDYEVTFSTKDGSDAVTVTIPAEDVPSAIARATARQRELWPAWLLELSFISAVTPASN